MPSPPKIRGGEEVVKKLKVSEDGRTAVGFEQVPTGQVLEPGWTVAEDDPASDYQFEIFLRDELVKTLVFHVQPPSATPGDSPANDK